MIYMKLLETRGKNHDFQSYFSEFELSEIFVIFFTEKNVRSSKTCTKNFLNDIWILRHVNCQPCLSSKKNRNDQDSSSLTFVNDPFFLANHQKPGRVQGQKSRLLYAT